MENKNITVVVCYAFANEQLALDVRLPIGATVNDALNSSQIFQYLKTPLNNYAVGIFGQQCRLDKVLKDGDRVEIYRDLPLSAQGLRQKKAQANKSK